MDAASELLLRKRIDVRHAWIFLHTRERFGWIAHSLLLFEVFALNIDLLCLELSRRQQGYHQGEGQESLLCPGDKQPRNLRGVARPSKDGAPILYRADLRGQGLQYLSY